MPTRLHIIHKTKLFFYGQVVLYFELIR